MQTRTKIQEKSVSIRFPLPVYERMRKYRSEHPHFSFNAFVVQTMIEKLDREDSAAIERAR